MGTGLSSFGPFAFDRDSGTLWREGRHVALGQRAAALLGALLAAEGAVVRKDALIEQAWPGSLVEENNLAVQIGTLRRILGRREDGSAWIVTAARAGYRLPRDPQVRGIPAIAVLPFVTMDDVGSFADGFVEDLITALSRFRTFAVVARTSAEGFRGAGSDARKVAQALGVRYLIEGSVRRDGNRVRLTAQLIDGASGVHLWAEKLDGVLADIFDFQDRLVARVVGVFEPKIRHAEIERARRKRPESLDAYDLYLQALPLVPGGALGGKRLAHYDNAIDLLDRAIAIDPHFAPALALGAWAHEKRFTRGGVAPDNVDDLTEALTLADRALAEDSSDAMVLLVAGALRLTLAGDAARAFPLLERAEALNPNSLVIASTTAYCYYHAGQIERSIASYARALTLTPWTPEAAVMMSGLARAHLSAGRLEEALRWGLRMLEANDGLFAHCVVTASYVHLGRLAEAEAQLRRLLTIWPELTLNQLLGRDTVPKVQDRLLEQGLRRAGLPVA
ncbi:MAG TPA: winged helix-turn-helix domain-containing protein [Hyphomicrobiaceae bacterium]|nr:winged helix-turn-helix domain-containing protein [Hyphomicrobiaceae bacterium]